MDKVSGDKGDGSGQCAVVGKDAEGTLISRCLTILRLPAGEISINGMYTRKFPVTYKGAILGGTGKFKDITGEADMTRPDAKTIQIKIAKPATPAAPGTPAEPATPAVPVTPAEPATPAIPVTPAEPATPAVPVTPAEPATPAVPVTPAEPATPAVPVTPAEPATPAVPVTPAEPVTPAVPAAPVENPANPG